MKKYIIAFAAIVFAVVSCNKEVDNLQPSQKGKRHITVLTETPGTRTVLDDEHNALLWAPGDNFRLMTNTKEANHDAQTLEYVANGKFEAEVSEDADEAYAYYFAGDYEDTNHSTPTAYTAYIESVQTQTKAGVLNGQMLPMAAKGTINDDNTVSLEFHQMAGVLALNIYSTAKIEGEAITSVKVTPTANTKFCGAMTGTNLTNDNVIYTGGTSDKYTSVTVELGEAYDYASSKPVDKKMFDGQIYVVLAKQSYTAVKFEIATNKGKYEITSSGAALDLVANDFYPVNINLAKATKVVAYEESFATDQGAFTVEGTAGTWTHGEYNGNGYMQAKKANATAWLISPVLSINSADSKLSFNQAINKYVTNASEELTVWIREVGGEWEQLTGFNYPSVAEGQTFSSFEAAEVALSKNGKNVQIGFKYVSSSSYGTWEVKDFKVTNASVVQPLVFNVVTKSPVVVPANPGNNVYEIEVEAGNNVVWTAALIDGDENAIMLGETEFIGSDSVEMMFDSNESGARSWTIQISTAAYVATPSYTIIVNQEGVSGIMTDVLDLAFTGVTGTSYANWSNKEGSASPAKYAGNSAAGNSSIQLRKSSATQASSGIITTTSGGYATKITVSWNSNTAAGRTLNVYGKNTAYSSVDNLYGDEPGTLLGTIVKGVSTELEIPYDCQFIGLRSNEGSMYLSEVRIDWSANASGTPLPLPTYNVRIASSISNGSVSSDKTTEIVSGESVTLTISPDDGYELKTLTVDNEDVTSFVSEGVYSFTMPSHDVIVTAQFQIIGGDTPGGDKTATIKSTHTGNVVQNLDSITETNNDITAVFSKGNGSQGIYESTSQIRVYTGNTITLTGGTIKKVVITCSAADYNKGFSADPVGSSSSSGAQWTWEGSTTELVLTSSGSSRIMTISITYN